MFQMNDHNRVRRLPERASYDCEAIYSVLDEGLLAHVGFVVDNEAVVIPMSYGRAGNDLILHGSVASRMLQTLSQGVRMSVCVTLLDGVVLARSVFHHSMNYRSVVVFGTARTIEDGEDKMAALDALVEHLVPGRTGHARPSSKKELAATTVLRMPMQDAALKRRMGGPSDAAMDRQLDYWAGVIPFRSVAGEPIPDAASKPRPVPEHVAEYSKGLSRV